MTFLRRRHSSTVNGRVRSCRIRLVHFVNLSCAAIFQCMEQRLFMRRDFSSHGAETLQTKGTQFTFPRSRTGCAISCRKSRNSLCHFLSQRDFQVHVNFQRHDMFNGMRFPFLIFNGSDIFQVHDTRTQLFSDYHIPFASGQLQRRDFMKRGSAVVRWIGKQSSLGRWGFVLVVAVGIGRSDRR